MRKPILKRVFSLDIIYLFKKKSRNILHFYLKNAIWLPKEHVKARGLKPALPLALALNLPSHDCATVADCAVSRCRLKLQNLHWEVNPIYRPPVCSFLCPQVPREHCWDSAQCYQLLLTKRNHCLVWLKLWKSMGHFVPSAACRTRSWRVRRIVASWAENQNIFVHLL